MSVVNLRICVFAVKRGGICDHEEWVCVCLCVCVREREGER